MTNTQFEALREMIGVMIVRAVMSEKGADQSNFQEQLLANLLNQSIDKARKALVTEDDGK